MSERRCFMSEMLEHIARLSQEIGPRPGGTEEEQEAALYVADQFASAPGIESYVEDYTGLYDGEMVRAILCGVAFLVTFISLPVRIFHVIALLFSLAATVLYAMEVLDRSVLRRVLSKGVSQNVVAKYVPSGAQTGRRRNRKVIIIAHYDSGKVKKELTPKTVPLMGQLNLAVLGAMGALVFFNFIRTVAITTAAGFGGKLMILLTLIALVIILVPVVQWALHFKASYNEAANCNASGVAVMIELAKRVAASRSAEDFENDAIMHGEEAAYDEGLVPEGVEFVYDENLSDDLQAEREQYGAAAIASLFGDEPEVDAFETAAFEQEEAVVVPVAVEGFAVEAEGLSDEAEAEADSFEPEAEVEAFTEDSFEAESEAPVAAAVVEDDPNVPDWFKKAQANAKRQPAISKPAARSRYADALESAEAAPSIFAPAAQAAANMGQQAFQVFEAPVQEAAEEAEVVEAAAELAVDVAAAGIEEIAEVAQDVSRETEDAGLDNQTLGQTVAMDPIDVSNLHLEEAPEIEEIPMPSFMNPRKVQIETMTSRGFERRTSERVCVTAEPLEVVEDYDESLAYVSQDAPVLTDVTPFAAKAVAEEPAQEEAVVEAPAAEDLEPVELPEAAPASQLASTEQLKNQRMASAFSKENPLFNLPSIDLGTPAESAQPASRPALRSILPSLSGEFRRVTPDDLSALPPLEGAPAVTLPASAEDQQAAFVTGASSSFDPVTSELLNQMPAEEAYVEDADDAYYDQADYAADDYIEKKESPFARIKGLFSRKKKEEFVDDGYFVDAYDMAYDDYAADPSATVGMPISFDQQQGEEDYAVADFEYQAQEGYESPSRFSQDAFFDGDDGEFLDRQNARKRRFPWQGGAFSPRQMLERATEAAEAAKSRVAEGVSNVPFGGQRGQAAEDDLVEARRARRAQRQAERAAAAGAGMGEEYVVDGALGASDAEGAQGEYASARDAALAALKGLPTSGDDALSNEVVAADEQRDNVEAIQSFQEGAIKTEVWFVALGGEEMSNSGTAAFLAEHRNELRGAFIIELDALGAGTLTAIEEEGTVKRVKASSRMKRYLRNATRATGIQVGKASLNFQNSAASEFEKAGCQVAHLVGMENGMPALYGSADDVIENIDAALLEDNADLVMEILRSV